MRKASEGTFTPATGVRIPLGTPALLQKSLDFDRGFSLLGRLAGSTLGEDFQNDGVAEDESCQELMIDRLLKSHNFSVSVIPQKRKSSKFNQFSTSAEVCPAL